MTSRVIYDPKQYKYACALGVHPEEQFEVLNECLKTYEGMRFIDHEKEAEKSRKIIEETQKEWRKRCEEDAEEFKVFKDKKGKKKGRRARKKNNDRKRGDLKKFQSGGIYAIKANMKLQKIMEEDYDVPFLMTGHTTQGFVFFNFGDFFFIGFVSKASKSF